ncbi:MAG: hydroxymethylglutaryl-CoA reductase [Candidatus Micrarchaeaceae archaeon]
MQGDEKIRQAVSGMLNGDKTYTAGGLEGSDAALARASYIEQKYKASLEHVKRGIEDVDFGDAEKRNIENAVGTVQVPVGFVEIKVNGEYASGVRPIFLATTEGRLVAGVNRGASAINMSGGATARIMSSGMTRSVIIETNGISDSKRIADFVVSDVGKRFIAEEFSKSTKHGRLIDVQAFTTGRLVYIRYVADTKAAMGMNMVTIASTNATNALVGKLKSIGIDANFMSESGNLCTDKKPSYINALLGRGVSVVAEATITKEALEKYFNASAKDIEALNYSKNYVGSGLAGSLAHNAQAANILAATFIAYGQDAAQVVDGSIATDDAKALSDGSLYISVYIPSLEIGTFGGGTHRETQKELLAASGFYGEGDEQGFTKLAFAECIAATVLAGELNLLAAEAGKELSKAHASIRRRN